MTDRKTAQQLAALADPVRVRVFDRLLKIGPVNVGELAEYVGIPFVNISHHLGTMRAAGLIVYERDGRKLVYSINPDILAEKSAGALAVLCVGRWRMVFPEPPK